MTWDRPPRPGAGGSVINQSGGTTGAGSGFAVQFASSVSDSGLALNPRHGRARRRCRQHPRIILHQAPHAPLGARDTAPRPAPPCFTQKYPDPASLGGAEDEHPLQVPRMITRLHSPRTLSSPRSRNCRKSDRLLDVTTLSSKHQISIPKSVRDAKHWKPGQMFAFVPRDGGRYILVPVPTRDELAGSMCGTDGKYYRYRNYYC